MKWVFVDFVSLHDSIPVAVVNEVVVAAIPALEDWGPNVLDLISDGGKMKKEMILQ